MAGVPDTNNFSLQDVVNVVGGNSLQDCFDNSVDAFFDPDYKGSKDSLYCFRNYGGSVEMWIDYSTGLAAGDIFRDDAAWATVRGANTGDSADTAGSWLVYVEYSGGVYSISRGFMKFDLSDIPATATCEEAGIGLDVIDTFGASNYAPVGLIGTQGDTITIIDYDAFTFGNDLMSDFDESPGSDFEVYNSALKANGSTELGRVEDAFGGSLYVALLNHYYDDGNHTPSDKRGIEIFRSGEVHDYPALRVVFTI